MSFQQSYKQFWKIKRLNLFDIFLLVVSFSSDDIVLMLLEEAKPLPRLPDKNPNFKKRNCENKRLEEKRAKLYGWDRSLWAGLGTALRSEDMSRWLKNKRFPMTCNSRESREDERRREQVFRVLFWIGD